MKARLVVFPIRGRNWCFSRSIDHSLSEAVYAQTPSTFKDLWKKISSSSSSTSVNHNAELIVDFVSNKMNRAWSSLEKAPAGSFKNKLHGLGLRLLARVKPSEIFLKSISKEVTKVEITYPSSLNARLVRRRLRHIALRGAVVHRKYLYGSVSLLPLTSAFTVLPLPNIPFFWILFRTYSHWRALSGSRRLLQLISDRSEKQNSSAMTGSRSKTAHDGTENGIDVTPGSQWVFHPSKELENLLRREDTHDGLSRCIISDICKTFDLNTLDVLKYRNSM